MTDYRKAGGQVLGVDDDHDLGKLKHHALQADLMLDGVLGTGMKLPLKGEIQRALATLNVVRDLPPVVRGGLPLRSGLR